MVETESNIDYLIPYLQMMIGDIAGTQYSESVYRTALIAGARILSKPLGNKYIVLDDNVIRNTTDYTFDSTEPYIDNVDEVGFLYAAIVVLRNIPLAGSSAFIGTWSTPDLSLSNVQGNKSYLDLLTAARKDLVDFLKMRLGRSQKSFLPTLQGLYPYYQQGLRDREGI